MRTASQKTRSKKRALVRRRERGFKKGKNLMRSTANKRKAVAHAN